MAKNEPPLPRNSPKTARPRWPRASRWRWGRGRFSVTPPVLGGSDFLGWFSWNSGASFWGRAGNFGEASRNSAASFRGAARSGRNFGLVSRNLEASCWGQGGSGENGSFWVGFVDFFFRSEPFGDRKEPTPWGWFCLTQKSLGTEEIGLFWAGFAEFGGESLGTGEN